MIIKLTESPIEISSDVPDYRRVCSVCPSDTNFTVFDFQDSSSKILFVVSHPPSDIDPRRVNGQYADFIVNSADLNPLNFQVTYTYFCRTSNRLVDREFISSHCWANLKPYELSKFSDLRIMFLLGNLAITRVLGSHRFLSNSLGNVYFYDKIWYVPLPSSQTYKRELKIAQRAQVVLRVLSKMQRCGVLL